MSNSERYAQEAERRCIDTVDVRPSGYWKELAYLGKDKHTNQLVAIKHLTNAGVFISKVLELRFEEKARAMLELSRFPHANIVVSQDYYPLLEDKSALLIMDFAGWGSLQHAFHSIRRSDWFNEKLIDTFVQVCRALSWAHDHNVVHGDLKPSNILCEEGPWSWTCTRDPAIRVADFGLSVPISSAHHKRFDDFGLAFVDEWYMSPEQSKGWVVDARSDIYALGCIMFEVYSGSLLSQIFKPRKVSALPVDHPDFWAEDDPGYGAIIRKANARDPYKRYQQISEMLHDLECLKSELQAKQRPGERTFCVPQTSSASGITGTSGQNAGISANAEPASHSAAERRLASAALPDMGVMNDNYSEELRSVLQSAEENCGLVFFSST